MRSETWLRHNNARFIYFSYKDSPYYSFLILIIIISVSIVLIFNILMPQANSWFSIRDESIATQQRISIITGNIDYMSKLNKTALENNRQTVIRALPVEKDFADIINAVGVSAVRSGISVNDFTFALGSVPTASSETIMLELSLNGSIDGIKTFIKEIGEKLPLSEVDAVDTTNTTTAISLKFHSKSYRPLKIRDEEPIRPVSAENGTILGTLSTWSSNTSSDPLALPPPSSSIPLF